MIKTTKETYAQIFSRFLKFGCLAWGGPVAQIDMIRQDMVEERKIISRERFNRLLGIYQILPGPEATELAIYCGILSRGGIGGLLAGLGFVLPGFLLMLLLSWFYIAFGATSLVFAGLFYGFQPAIMGLIIRALHRLGKEVLQNSFLWFLTIGVFFMEIMDIPFFVSLPAAGLAHWLYQEKRYGEIIAFVGLMVGIVTLLLTAYAPSASQIAEVYSHYSVSIAHSPLTIFMTGLKSGLLTFGGAYTVIPFMQHFAVEVNQWMNNTQFLDGLSLSGIVPAPLIIFATFVGYFVARFNGAILITLGIFLPAFLITLLEHRTLEKLIQKKSIHGFLDGVVAGVIGLIAVTALKLFTVAVQDIKQLIVLLAALSVLYLWQRRLSVLVVMIGAGIVGYLLQLF